VALKALDAAKLLFGNEWHHGSKPRIGIFVAD
jgi:hypothetical protein